jgi:hypothetical protein
MAKCKACAGTGEVRMYTGRNQAAPRCDACAGSGRVRAIFTTPNGNAIEIEEGPPNLDAMTADKLMSFWVVAHYHPVKVGRAMFPERPAGYVSATRTLACYASNKAPAMTLRAEGEITRAGVYEGICEIVYDQLPEFARW